MMKIAVPLQQIYAELLRQHAVNLYILRTDLNHPLISGNKLFKLKYNILKAKQQNKNTLLTFGGAWSNHIAATAAAGKEQGFKTIGIIRGEKVNNPTLSFAEQNGMELYFVSRELYRNKEALSEYAEEKISAGSVFVIPEGGSNMEGIQGCREIASLINIPFDTICCPCGTGTTMAGIILSLNENQHAIGFQALKGDGYIRKEINEMLNHFEPSTYKNWHIEDNFHFGGYAKTTTVLTDFIQSFESEHSIPLDFIYTGKMMTGIYSMIEKGHFKKGETIIAVHTGGIQGNAGINFQNIQLT